MLIANPIYDVVFKRLMENDRVAKYFISTLLGQKVLSLSVKPQEFTYTDELTGLRLFRLDFMAIIETETGENRKILIEIQKAKDEIDIIRFRNYLAEQYKKQDKVDDELTTLPITTIYIFGFKLPNIKTACLHVKRHYHDLINETIITHKNSMIEALTHDSYIVQAKRITKRYKTPLDKLLSVFEQDNFIGDTQTVKNYLHQPDDENVKAITDILHYTGTDPKTRKEIEDEHEAWRTMNALFEKKEKVYKKALEEKDKALNEKDKALSEKDKALSEKDNELETQRKLIEELRKKLNEE